MSRNARRHPARAACLLAALIAYADASAQDPVKIAPTVPYAEGIGTDAMKSECSWNTELSGHIVSFAKGSVEIAAGDLAAQHGKALTMVITNAHASGGGRWSGPKWGRVRGELRDAGQLVGSFEAQRNTMVGMTACAALSRIAAALGKDIAQWIAQPTLEARLGDAR